MTFDPFAILGLAGNASAEDVRSAFRQRIVQHHPDVVGEAGTADTRRLLDAYRAALVVAESAVGRLPDVPAAVEHESTWLIDRDTIALACDHHEAFARVLDVAHHLGAITYLDRQGDLLEVLLRTRLGDTLSLVMSFQGRSEWVEVFLTTEVLDVAKHELPTVDQITELVLHHLRVDW